MVRHFPSTKTQRDFHLIALFEEALNGATFNFIVMLIDIGPHLDLFDLNDFLLLLGFSLLFLLLVFVFPVIENFTDRRLCIWRNFDKIEACLHGDLEGGFGIYDSALFARMIDKQNLRHANLIVDARAIGFRGRGCEWSTGYERFSLGCFSGDTAFEWATSHPNLKCTNVGDI